MNDRPQNNVLFLCTGNSARSILAEAIMNTQGAPRFRAYSAGSHPAGAVNPFALRLLAQKGLSTAGMRSKSWDEFAAPGAPTMHFVFTVCSSAAGEVCPVWPGQPITAHWGIDDPAVVQGEDAVRMQAFRTAFGQLQRRIELFLSLPLASMSRLAAKQAVDDIGRTAP